MSSSGTAKASISMPAELFLAAEQRRQEMGYATFSAYLQYLIRDDILRRPSHFRLASPAPNAVALNEPSSTPPAPTALQAADLALRKVTKSSGKPDKPTRAKQ